MNTNDSVLGVVTNVLIGLYGKDLDINRMETEEKSVLIPICSMNAPDLPSPTLQITERKHSIHIQVSPLAYLGSPGSLMNFTPSELLTAILFRDIGQPADSNPHNDWLLMRLLANTYLASAHTIDELFAAAIHASNAKTVFTKAVVQPEDGEVYVSTRISSTATSIPEEVEMISLALLDHASRIRKFIQTARIMVQPNAINWQEIAASLCSPSPESRTADAPAKTTGKRPRRETL